MSGDSFFRLSFRYDSEAPMSDDDSDAESRPEPKAKPEKRKSLSKGEPKAKRAKVVSKEFVLIPV